MKGRRVSSYDLNKYNSQTGNNLLHLKYRYNLMDINKLKIAKKIKNQNKFENYTNNLRLDADIVEYGRKLNENKFSQVINRNNGISNMIYQDIEKIREIAEQREKESLAVWSIRKSEARASKQQIPNFTTKETKGDQYRYKVIQQMKSLQRMELSKEEKDKLELSNIKRVNSSNKLKEPIASYKNRIRYDNNRNKDNINNLHSIEGSRVDLLNKKILILETESDADDIVDNNINSGSSIIRNQSPLYYKKQLKNNSEPIIENGKLKLDSLLTQDDLMLHNLNYPTNQVTLISSKKKTKKLVLPTIPAKKVGNKHDDPPDLKYQFKAKSVHHKLENYFNIKQNIFETINKRKVADNMLSLVLVQKQSSLDNFGSNYKQEIEDEVNELFKEQDYLKNI